MGVCAMGIHGRCVLVVNNGSDVPAEVVMSLPPAASSGGKDPVPPVTF